MLVCFPFLHTALIYVARYHISLPCQKHAFGNDFRAASNIFFSHFILYFIFINFFAGYTVKIKLCLEETKAKPQSPPQLFVHLLQAAFSEKFALWP